MYIFLKYTFLLVNMMEKESRVNVKTTAISAHFKLNKLCLNTFNEIVYDDIGPKHFI